MPRVAFTVLAGLALSLVGLLPTPLGVLASPTERHDDVHVVGSGPVDVTLTAIDGLPVGRSALRLLDDHAVGSTFAVSHVLTVRNTGNADVKELRLTIVPGWHDSTQLAQSVALTVSTSLHGLPAATLPASSLQALERHPLTRLPLPSPVKRGQDVRITLGLSAADLDNALQGAAVHPSYVFTFGG